MADAELTRTSVRLLVASVRAMAVAVGLCAASAAPAIAQADSLVTLIGEVREYTSERPLPDVAVKILELERVVVTDRNGFFAFDSLPAGRWTFETSGFGYVTNVEASDIGPRALMVIRLESDPVQLEGLYVGVTQGLVRRRMAAPSRVWAWDRAELEAAISADIGNFVRQQGVAQFIPCGDEFSPEDLPHCFIRRGRPTRLNLFVDDVALLPREGTSRLWAYDPRDLWSVEFLPGCAQLRIYTRQFMEWVEEGRVRMVPMLCTY